MNIYFIVVLGEHYFDHSDAAGFHPSSECLPTLQKAGHAQKKLAEHAAG